MSCFAQKQNQHGRESSPDSAHSRETLTATEEARPFLQLQRSIGNQAVLRLLSAAHAGAPLSLRRKTKVSSPGDAQEREADRAAEEVVREPEPGREKTCHCGGACPACRSGQSGHERLQRKSAGGSVQPFAGNGVEGESAPPIVGEVLGSAGRPLDAGARRSMESRFGHDFGHVRVHTDARASASASAVDALAYTVGRDIVFGAGQYAPHTRAGMRLLAHELAHVAQASRGGEADTIRRQKTFFGPNKAPADWAEQVKKATTSADRATLIKTAVGLTVNDATAASATDTSPTPAHLKEYSAASQTINYDDGLNTKKSAADGRTLSINAGYTLHSGGKHYVILGPKVLTDDYYDPIVTVNHEFDHIRQHESGSTLKGDESELDAWTSSFIRDFHRTYLLGDTGSTCFVQSINTYTPLFHYYSKKDERSEEEKKKNPSASPTKGVRDAQRDANVKRITDYYTATVSPHEGHKAAFKYWLYRALAKLTYDPHLGERLNTELKLGLKKEDDIKTIRQFSCGTAKTLAYSEPTLDKPTLPSAPPPTSQPTKKEEGAK